MIIVHILNLDNLMVLPDVSRRITWVQGSSVERTMVAVDCLC